MIDRENKNNLLPPRPGEVKKPQQDMNLQIVVCYVKGQLVHMSKIEALDLMAQVTQSLMYLENPPPIDVGEKYNGSK